jgi:2'-hydroxyisoflavone reductase
MTDLLVLGGTAWLGREVARAGIARGYEVTCLARGESGPAVEGARLVRADRTAPDAYEALSGREWDAVVDVSWQPAMVRSALQALGGSARHWAYVSSGSVYARHDTPGADESAALLPALEGPVATREQYGEAKVACEQACREALPDRLLVARAGLIAGYGDRSDRFGYWPARLAAAADGDPAWAAAPAVLVPDTPQAPTQAIDVRDLAEWLVRTAEAGTTGTYNTAGAPHTLEDVLAAASAATGLSGDLELVDSGWLREQGVQEYMGPRSLPLWIADPEWAGFSARDTSAARAAGLTHRPLTDLVEQSLRWERELGLGRPRSAGLTPEQERELLRAWAARS